MIDACIMWFANQLIYCLGAPHPSRKNSSHGVMAGTCGNIRWPFLAKWRDGSNLTGTAANPTENDETSVEKMMMNQDQLVSVYFFGFSQHSNVIKCIHTYIYIYNCKCNFMCLAFHVTTGCDSISWRPSPFRHKDL